MGKFFRKSTYWLSAVVIAVSATSCGSGSSASDTYLKEIQDAKIVPAEVLSTNKLMGYVDSRGELAIPARFKSACYFHDGVALVTDTAGLAGYINPDGDYVISPKYISATNFTEGLAWVAEPDSSLMVIDKKGNVKFRFEKAYTADCFFDGISVFTTATGNLGFVKTDGSEIAVPDSIESVTNIAGDKIYFKYRNKRHGVGRIAGDRFEPIAVPGNPDIENANLDKELLIYYVDGKRGVMDFNGKIIINPRYSKLDFDGKDLIIFESDKEKYGWLDLEGKEVIPAKYKAVRFLFGATDYAVVSTTGTKFQTINRKGETVIKAKYERLFHPRNAPDVFAMKDDKLCGLLTPDGTVLCEPQFEDINFCSEHVFMATSGDGKWGVIDTSGRYQGAIDYRPVDPNAFSAQSQKVDIDNIVAIAMKYTKEASFRTSWPDLAKTFSLSKYDTDLGNTNVTLKNTEIPGAKISFEVMLDKTALTSARTIAKSSFNPYARPYAYLLTIILNNATTRDNVFSAMEKATGLPGEVSELTDEILYGTDYKPNSITLFITPDEQFLNTIR